MLFTTVNLIGVILTISRGAIVSLVVCLALYLITLIFNRKVKKIKSLIGVAALAFGFYLFIRFTIPGMELWDGLAGGVKANSVGTRQILWGEAIREIGEKPFGNGIIWRNDPHNIILKSVRDLGVWFGVIFLFLISYPLFNVLRLEVFRRTNKSIAILIAYLSIFIHSMIEVFYFTNTSIIWVVFVLSFLNKTLKEETTNQNPMPQKETLLVHGRKLIAR